MPRNECDRFFVWGSFQQRTILRMSRTNHPRSRLSTRHHPAPYRSPCLLMEQVDSPSYNWYHDEGQDLHQHNFIFLAWMQTARRMQQRAERFPDRDHVLERLMEEGTFDHRDPDVPDVREELAMAHSSAMAQRLLMRVEKLEKQVHCGCLALTRPWSNLLPSISWLMPGTRSMC